MKILLATALILSASASAFADHTAFASKAEATPAATESTESKWKTSPYPPYTRNAAHVPAKSAKQSDASKRPASRYPAYTRNAPHAQPESSAVAVTAAGATSQKRSEVSDK